MNSSEYFVNMLKTKLKVDHVFCVTGGFAMFLNDAFGRSGINIKYFHHEAAAAYAAVGYYKKFHKPCVVLTTAGVAATNAISPCVVAYQDSCNIIFVSGNTKSYESINYFRSQNKFIRHYSGADVDIDNIVKNITKDSCELSNDDKILLNINEILSNMLNGRPGPVWISFPLDVQSKNIEDLQYFPSTFNTKQFIISENQKTKFKSYLENSKRPICIIGNGVKLSKTESYVKLFIEKYGIPCVTTFFGVDVLETDSKYFIGRIGLVGDRNGNFAIQNADLVISLGCRLCQGISGYNIETFAREAKKIQIDIDDNEMKDFVDLKIKCDLREFFLSFENINMNLECSEWLGKCLSWKTKWFRSIPAISYEEKICPYFFYKKFFDIEKKHKSNYVCSSGSVQNTIWHLVTIKQGDRFILSSQGDMGFELPSGIGMALADDTNVTYVLLGEGSLQLNIQEFQTIIQNRPLNIKILVTNNNSYGAITITQDTFFGKRFGTDEKTGISFPKTEKICEAYGIPFMKIEKYEDIDVVLPKFIEFKGACVCEVTCKVTKKFPKLSSKKHPDGSFSSRPFEDMEPFLSTSILDEEMLIKQI